MPSNWLAMDDNFPTFTGSESPKEQIAALHDYLFQMRQGLQYSMRNLTAENFNATALQQLTDEQKDAFAKELQVLINTVNQFSTELSNLSARVLAVEKLGARVTGAEEAITYLQKAIEALRAEEHECDLAQLQTAVQELQEGQAAFEEQMTAAQVSIDELEQEQTKLSGAMQVADDGSATIGGEGKTVHLVGQIYINGQLYQSGGEAI